VDALGTKVFPIREETNSGISMKRGLILLVLVALAMFSGFYQEKVKISINYILDQGAQMPGFFNLSPAEKQVRIEQARVNAPFDYYHNHKTISFLYRFDARQLSVMKWVVTGVFMGWFLLLNLSLLHTLRANSAVVSALPRLYLVVALFSLAVFALGIAGFQKEKCYAVSREIMGALQSIVPVLLIWPASRLWDQSKSLKEK
jgi:hypothetical protein